MPNGLAGWSIAILAANGFNEHHLTTLQRALIKTEVTLKTIAPETKVMNSWQGDSWGHYFPVDRSIHEALGSDFDSLIILGGERSVQKLSTNLHARRIINHFFDAQKPILAIERGIELLGLSPKIQGRTIAAESVSRSLLENQGAIMSERTFEIDPTLFTVQGESFDDYLHDLVLFVCGLEEASEAA